MVTYILISLCTSHIWMIQIFLLKMYYFSWLANIRGEKANEKLRELFEKEKYAEIVQLYVPHPVFKVGNDLVNVWWKVWDIYWIFAILRILLVIFPQPGYIHPDEYFQTVEVITGDVLGSRFVWIFLFNMMLVGRVGGHLYPFFNQSYNLSLITYL